MTKKKRKKIGRPRAEDPRHRVLGVKVMESEDKLIRLRAAKAGLTVSKYILREVLKGE